MKTAKISLPSALAKTLLALTAATLLAPSLKPQATPIATISIDGKHLGAQIPRDFVGISLEVSTAGQGIGAFAADGTSAAPNAPIAVYALGAPDLPNETFFRLMRNLGPGVLRLGGNSQDNTCWKPAAAAHLDWCKGELTRADFQLFSRAATASGWRLIVGINLKQNSPAWALSEVTDGIAPEIAPAQTAGLELGNEPDLFSRDNGARPQSYSAADHAKDFLAYRDTFAQNAAASKYSVIGPATCCAWRNPKDLGTFIDGVGAANLKLVTVHNYPLTTCNGKTLTIDQLLAPEVIARFNAEMQALAAAAHERNLPIALAETNSASCGGMPRVSNAFAAALWGIDTLFAAAEDGLSGVNLHISYRPGGSSYNPVNTYAQPGASGRRAYVNSVEPLYYGMYLFAQNSSGEFLLQATTQTDSNIRSYATTACSNCAIHVVVINADRAAAGKVHVVAGTAAGSADLLLLKAPHLASMAQDATYGGAQFDGAGHIAAPQVEPIQSDSNGNYFFQLPNAAAAVLTIRPKRQ